MTAVDLARYKFSGLKLCKLVGITHHQFQSFKLAGLIENKHKYTLNDVIYVAISNIFRECKKSWSTIHNLYTQIFGSPESFLNLITKESLYKYDYIWFLPAENNYSLTHRNELKQYKFKKEIIPGTFNQEPLMIEYVRINQNTEYRVNISRILEQIINNSKQLDLKVNVEQILTAA